MSQNWERQPLPAHILHTAYPLRRIAWRPGHGTEIAIVPLAHPLSSSSASIDHPDMSSIVKGHVSQPYLGDQDAHLEIWDVRRHYVSKSVVPSADGMAIGVEWSDEDGLVAAFQGGGFAQLDLRNQTRLPLDTIPRQATSWNVRGEMAYALDQFKLGEIPFDNV